MQIGSETYSAKLEDNETVKAWLETLPAEYEMSELNGNEKYFYLGTSLPANAENPGTINKGDIMLYGSDCIVVFYKTFSTSYSYTKIGHIENAENIDTAVGNGSITMKFGK